MQVCLMSYEAASVGGMCDCFSICALSTVEGGFARLSLRMQLCPSSSSSWTRHLHANANDVMQTATLHLLHPAVATYSKQPAPAVVVQLSPGVVDAECSHHILLATPKVSLQMYITSHQSFHP